MVIMKRQKILICGWDGYIGFPLTLRCLHNGHVVHGVDNYSRRRNVEAVGSTSATNITNYRERISDLSVIGDFTTHEFDVNESYVKKHLENLIHKGQFDTIINLAHNPSAPFSMMDKNHANEVLTNNIIGTNNILWAIKQYSPNSHYITIGSTGEYDHVLGVDIEEGYFQFDHNGKTSKKCLFPRQGNSVYHCSKIASTYLIDYLSRIWNLKCTDIMQSIVYGLYTPEMETYKQVNRCDTDDCFGTVINRFVVQSILGVPMTVFGYGMHQRAFLSLNDSIQALELAINNPAQPGVVQTWNQLSEWHSINAITDIVTKVIPNARVRDIESPRKEFTGGHYYNLISDNLKALGYIPTRNIEEEIRYMISKVIINSNRKILESVVQPKVVF